MAGYGNVKFLEVGACQVFFNNRPLGYTKGGVSVKTAAETADIEVDQENDPVISTQTKKTKQITVPIAEMTLENLLLAFSGARIEGTYPNEYIAVGATGETISGTLRLHPTDKADDDYSNDMFFGNVSPSEEAEIPYTKGELRAVSITFNAKPADLLDGDSLHIGNVPTKAMTPLGSIGVGLTQMTMKAGDSGVVRVLYTPESAFFRDVTATSDDEDIAIVQSVRSGYVDVLGISAGTATVTLKSTKDPTKTTSFDVVVA